MKTKDQIVNYIYKLECLRKIYIRSNKQELVKSVDTELKILNWVIE